MTRILAFTIIVVLIVSQGVSAPARKEVRKQTGILVLDNCDPQYQDKEKYEDNLTLVDSAGKQVFRISGFNNCESIGSSRMIAADPVRKCIWVVENVAIEFGDST